MMSTTTFLAHSIHLPSSKELTVLGSPENIIPVLINLKLLLPFDRPCPKCKETIKKRNREGEVKVPPLHPVPDTTSIDGLHLRCRNCKGNWGIRHGSIFSHSRQPLAELMRYLKMFESHICMSAAVKISELCEESMRLVWRGCRLAIWQYMIRHPVVFDADDVVEIDECYLKMLQEKVVKVKGKVKEKKKFVWIIGLIGRKSGKVALIISPDHKKKSFQPLVKNHLPHHTTITLSDQHKSFNFLEQTQKKHEWVIKKKSAGKVWMEVEEVTLYRHYDRADTVENKATFLTHTNTIEGFWAHFRREIIGCQKNKIALYLAQVMFRRLNVSLINALTPS